MINTTPGMKRDLNLKGLAVLMTAIAMLCMPFTANALFENEIKLTASDGASGDFFGWSVSISGDTAIAGASLDDDNGSSSGSAYVFVRDAAGLWIQQQKLIASDGAADDSFGYSVSISGDTAIVGAYLHDDNYSSTGSAYVFVRDAAGLWTEEQKLLATDGESSDYFGYSVSISGDTAIVGAYGDDDMGSSTGSAYVFVRDATGVWTERQKLLAPDTGWQDSFGRSVSISGDTAIVGAYKDGDTALASGAAYVFVRDATGVWTEEQKLLASDGESSDYFGASVSINGDTAIVGAFQDDDNGSWSGSAYVFVRDAAGAWILQQKLIASDGATYDRFGWSVSISGDTAIAGAYGDADNGMQTGSAYVFVRDAAGAWTEQKLTASDGTILDSFGVSVSISGDTVIAGAYGNFGSAYVYQETAVTPAPEIEVTDSIGAAGDLQMPFGDVTVGTSSTAETATISNVGTIDLNVTNIQLTGTNTGEYTLNLTGGTSPCGSATPTVPAGTNCTVTITFSPTSTGSKTANLAINSDDADEGTVNVALSGTGTTVTAPDIDVTDTIGASGDRSMPFGDVLIGSSSTVETVTISNVGNDSLIVYNIQLTGADALEYSLDLTGGASPCGSTTPTVPAAGNCTVTITFSPVITGAKTANLEISSDDADEGTVNVTLSGTGIAVPAPEIDVTETIAPTGDGLMPFGNITEGLSSAVETVTISNTGAIDLNVSNIQLTGVDTGEYSLDLTGGGTCGSATPTVPAGTNCTVTVTFSPTSVGLKTANLAISSDDADEGTVNVALSGTGLVVAMNNPPSSPNLVSPADGQQGLATMVTLSWQPATDPDGDTVSYDVYNCTDSDPVANCTSAAVAKLNRGADESGYRYAGVGYGGGAAILGLMLAGGMYGRRRIALVVMTIVLSATFLASCHFDEDKTYTVSGLDTGSTYYWVVVANDGNGGETPSAVWSYTTAP